MSQAEKKWCSQTIKALKKHKRAIAFLDPVDPIQFNIPDYFDIVKSPMDLGTVENKLMAEQYSTVDEFKADVQLVFHNCYLYNNSGDPVCLDAKKLEEQYHKLCKKEPSALASTENNSDQYNLTRPVKETLNAATTIPDSNAHTLSIIPPTTPTTITIPTKPKKVSSIKVKLPASALNASTQQPTPIISSPPIEKTDGMPDDQFKRCEAIVKELKKPKYQGMSWPFLNPVDAAAWGATDYYEIIKHPMDMTTYERKLYASEYMSENELVEDIRLMFRNCYAYNPADHLVHNLGKEFQQVFEKQWAKLQSRSSNKRSSSAPNSTKHTSKKRRTSNADEAYVNQSIADQPISQKSLSPHHIETVSDKVDKSPKLVDIPLSNKNKSDRAYKDVDSRKDEPRESAPKPTPTVSSNNTSNAGRSTILRLKLSVKPKEEEPQKAKPTPKAQNLSLSKEPPSATAASGPKLAIGSKPTSPIKEKKSEKSTVLQNHDKWLALAKKSPTPPLKSQLHTVKKEVISPVHPTPKPKEIPPPAPPATFDINDLYNKIHNEKKLKEQKKREEQEKWEKSERIRLEKEKIASEERMKQIREFNQHLQAQRQKDKAERLRQLDASSIDISKQKMIFAKFESMCMARDQDWREMYTWQRDTIDYRHIPAPGFVKRAPIKLDELRKRLLSKCVRLENSKLIHQVQNLNDDDGSDMDIE